MATLYNEFRHNENVRPQFTYKPLELLKEDTHPEFDRYDVLYDEESQALRCELPITNEKETKATNEYAKLLNYAKTQKIRTLIFAHGFFELISIGELKALLNHLKDVTTVSFDLWWRLKDIKDDEKIELVFQFLTECPNLHTLNFDRLEMKFYTNREGEQLDSKKLYWMFFNTLLNCKNLRRLGLNLHIIDSDFFRDLCSVLSAMQGLQVLHIDFKSKSEEMLSIENDIILFGKTLMNLKELVAVNFGSLFEKIINYDYFYLYSLISRLRYHPCLKEFIFSKSPDRNKGLINYLFAPKTKVPLSKIADRGDSKSAKESTELDQLAVTDVLHPDIRNYVKQKFDEAHRKLQTRVDSEIISNLIVGSVVEGMMFTLQMEEQAEYDDKARKTEEQIKKENDKISPEIQCSILFGFYKYQQKIHDRDGFGHYMIQKERAISGCTSAHKPMTQKKE